MTKTFTMVAMLVATASCVANGGDGADGDGEELTASGAFAEASAAMTTAEQEGALPVPFTQLARVTLPLGDVVFRASQEPDQAGALVPVVTMLEMGRPDSTGRVSLLAGDLSPLAAYLTITPSTVPVPRLLVSTEASLELRNRAALRPAVDAVTAPITGLVSASTTTALGSVSQYCTGGTSAAWAANICTLTNWDVDFCHNGTWYSVFDAVGSDNKKRNSRGYTLGCGANSRVRHYYKFWGVWHKPIDEILPSNQIWRTTQNGNWALQREVQHSRTAAGFVRASSHFNVGF